MAFERITLMVGTAKPPATITITQAGKTVLAVRKDLIAAVGFRRDMTFGVLLGTGADAGRLRLVEAMDGVACARELERAGAFFFSLGPVAALGVVPRKRRPAMARIVEGGIEIDIAGDDGPKSPSEPARSPAGTDAEAGKASGNHALDRHDAVIPKPGSAGIAAVNGVKICLAQDRASVTFNGRSVTMSAREAKFVDLLARARPAPVAVSFLIQRIWDKAPPTAGLMVGQMASNLRQSLLDIGLNVNLVKGVGYQLRDA